MTEKKNNIKKALLLAGKIALAAQFILDATTFNLSSRIKNLEQVLNEYNNFIIKNLNECDNK